MIGKWHAVVFKINGDWASNPYDTRREAFEDAMYEFNRCLLEENDIHFIAVYYVPLTSTLTAAFRQDPERKWTVKEL